MSSTIQPASDTGVRAAPSGHVMATLRNWIEAGRYREGQPLPSEREVAKRLDVARTTVRSAFDELHRQGLIERGGGRRRRVVRSVTAQTAVLGQSVGIFSNLSAFLQPGQPLPRGWDLFTYGETIRALQARGVHALLMSPTAITSDGLVRVLAGRPFGMVLTREVKDDADRRRIVEACRAYHVPLVADGDGPELQGVSRVTSDHDAGCYLLTRWLLDRGCRRLLRFRPDLDPMPDWLRRRDSGFERALADAGLAAAPPATYPIPRPIWNDGPVRELFDANVRTVAGHLLDHVRGEDRPDAIVALTDSNARLVAAALRFLGLRPHDDILVVGYDHTFRDDPEAAFEPFPPDATIDKCNDRVGQTLADLLAAIAGRPTAAQPTVVRIAPRLVEPNASP